VEAFAFGKVRLVQDGHDVCILGYGPILGMAREVADRLEQDGTSVALVSAHTVKPLDVEGIARLLHRFPVLAVVEEHTEVGRLGEKVKRIAWDSGASGRVLSVALRDELLD